MSRTAAAGPEDLHVQRLGLVRYAEALELQTELRDRRLAGEVGDTVLLLEHPDVVTFGRGASGEHARLSDEQLRARGYDVERVNRGGDVTWHGPGQLIGYPILDLAKRGRDVHVYLRELEGVLIDALADFGIAARRRDGYTGVWLDEASKIASIGVGVRRWVTLHGFALNVDCDLERFDVIVACGLTGVRMTSMREQLGAVDRASVTDRVESHLRKRLASSGGEGRAA
jgi:lipoate-protein ligase B